MLIAHPHVSLVNPRHVRHFAKSSGQEAKTDKLDAKILAKFGAAMTPRRYVHRDAVRAELDEILSRRTHVVRQRTQEVQYREHVTHASLLERSDASILAFDAEIKALTQQACALTEKDEELHQQYVRLQTIPGVGPLVALCLLVDMPELGTLNKGEVASLAGLAPFNHDSGLMRGKRSIRGGRARVRQMLFIAATANQRCKRSDFKDTTHALQGRGKPSKVARCAVARKFVVVANAMLKTKCDYVAKQAVPRPEQNVVAA